MQAVVDKMFEDGLKALTGAGSLQCAWEALLPYQSGDIVAIHLNAYANANNNQKNNVYQTVSALVYGLVDVLNIPANKIGISDPSRTLVGSAAQERIINDCRHTADLGWDMYRSEFTGTIPFTSGEEPQNSSQLRFSRLMTDAQHVILVPVFSWHSSFITGALKLLIGSLSNMGASHSPTGYDLGNGARFADLCMPIKDKLRLVIGEGLFGNIKGNTDAPHAFQTLGGQGGQHPSSVLYFSKDPVATDSVMYDDILAEVEAEGSSKPGYKYGWLEKAADSSHNLGTFEMKAVTGQNSYSLIDLIDV